MMKSMTGFGKRESTVQGVSISAEIRSVNHRFREIMMRLPKGKNELEEELKQVIAQQCSRGRIEVSVAYVGGKESSKTLKLDRTLARQYHQVLQELQRELKLGGSIDVSFLGSFREIFSVGEPTVDSQAFDRAVKRLVVGAVEDLDRMRRREGKALQSDMVKRVQVVRQVQGQIRRRLPKVTKDYYDRMKDRLNGLIGDSALDDTRLKQELAIFADRCDVTEELIRLDSHCQQFDALVKAKDPVGRQLDFLLQEMGREVNTIGSKANDAEISKCVVQLKGELEKVREQVQNVE
ncbi:YicC/YloC family endoribonuclease [Candidatus Nitronereus thalassa]|uniref:YicC family protein n=1 Tax=Candidatus Nitronereus thalassa TaxID=3020898 RepID=A0ABU3K6M5_9BACT|nr:YicC/YloC family endoribonuclease [Candidatus Nitronereus thalassa]MDT7042045.1 YicC family protein [Candidatus Nitronereus thalassa]